jgi:cell division protein FtsN
MSPDRDSGRMGDDDLDVDERDASPRSIFSALWFRVLLAVLVLGVLAAIAVPYVLDTQTLRLPSAKPATAPPPAPATAATATPAAPATPPPVATAPSAEPPAAPADTAAPATPPPAPDTARPKSAASPAPAAKAPAAKPAPAKSAVTVAKAGESPKPAAKTEKTAPKVAEATTKASEATPKAAAAETTPKAADAPKASAPKAAGAAGGKAYWVQVGAFKDADTAKRIAARLREAGLRVEESSTTAGAAAPRTSAAPAAADRYDVVVSGASAADVEAKLAPKGFKGEATANGVVVRPSLALREAVALSRDLADAGLSVQVRRIGGTASTPAPVPTPAPTGGQTLYRVRVGGFPDRAAAVDAMKQLEGKGFKPFIARGNE